MKLSACTFLLILFTCSGAVASDWATGQFVQIGAHIDGRDRLIIQGNTLQWHHFDFAAVGRHQGGNSPTIINTGNSYTEWFPEWPEPVPSEIRFEAVSSVFSGLTPPLPARDIRWHVTKLLGRGEVHIIEQPSYTNQFKLIVDFDDSPIGGSNFYAIRLSFAKRVVMDIQPFTGANEVNPNSAKVIRVAVFSKLLSPGFDATRVVPTSVKFGLLGATDQVSGASPISSELADLNGDGHQDVVFSFRINETGISCGATEAVLSGNTVSGDAIEARDVVRTVHCQ
jgi:hypothetical protein